MSLARICPLCHSSSKEHIVRQRDDKSFFRCKKCQLVYTNSREYIEKNQEELHYLKHHNTIEQVGYVRFLSQVLTPMLPFLKPGAEGLDWGCGYAPVLCALWAQAGFACTPYDPFFYPQLPKNTFDFITATECFEHFHHPDKELNSMLSKLNEAGLLGIMTLRYEKTEQFQHWAYARDPTHVIYFHSDTFNYIREKWHLQLLYDDGQRVIIFQKENLFA